jgi:hypothetical protein
MRERLALNCYFQLIFRCKNTLSSQIRYPMHMERTFGFDWTIGENDWRELERTIERLKQITRLKIKMNDWKKEANYPLKDWTIEHWSELQIKKEANWFFSLSFFILFLLTVTLPAESVSRLVVLRKWWCGPIKSGVLKWVCS